MATGLFLLFLLIPFIEVALLVKLAGMIGFWETIAIQVGTAFLGANLAKMEGLRVWTKIQKELEQGLMPTVEMIDGLMVFAGGLVLLTPGLLTDILGFLLLFPITRRFFKSWIKPRFENMSESREASVTTILID